MSGMERIFKRINLPTYPENSSRVVDCLECGLKPHIDTLHFAYNSKEWHSLICPRCWKETCLYTDPCLAEVEWNFNNEKLDKQV